MATLRLILGDQLDPQHDWFAHCDPGVVYVLMEVRQETDYVRHHAQKLIAVFAAMRDFARRLRAAGHRVDYLAIDDPDNRQSLPANLEMLLARHGARRFEYQAPDEWRLDRQLAGWAETLPIPADMVDSGHFYTQRDEAARLFAGRRQWRMEHFYRRMRERHRVLMDGPGRPVGGRWNFDADNRKAWPGLPHEPADRRPVHDHSALWATIRAASVDSFGEARADAFRWPLNREEALAQLDAFVADGLPHFGDFQDATSRHARRLFHSLLSFALNVKMLRPQEVVDRAEAAWRDGRAPLAGMQRFARAQ